MNETMVIVLWVVGAVITAGVGWMAYKFIRGEHKIQHHEDLGIKTVRRKIRKNKGPEEE